MFFNLLKGLFQHGIIFALANISFMLFANIQSDPKAAVNQIIKPSITNLNTYRELNNRSKKIYQEKREQDKLNRRSQILNRFRPNSFGVKRQGQAVFVSKDLLEANIFSIQNMLRGTKLSPYRNFNGKTLGYSIKSTDRGSFVSLLGFKEGDLIHRIGKYDIDSMSAIYKAYRRILKSNPKK